jgi:multidrug efflux pump subunit AcrA (membrane-fusion protein)
MTAAATAASAQLAVNAARAKSAFGTQTASADITAKIAERALVVLDPASLGYAHMAADEKLEVARVGLNAAQLDGQILVQAALDAQKAAAYDAQLTAERADRLAADLAAAKARLGVQVPVDEIVFIPTLPGRVEAITALVGAAATGPVLSVTDNQITIDGALPLDVAPLVKPGMAVDIDEQALGIKTKGVVDHVEKTPGTHGVDGYHIYFAVRVDEASTPLQGFSLRMTIPIESSAGEVLTVPVSAVSLAADGKSRVQVQDNEALRYVNVEPGLAANGFVEVRPLEGQLDPGQLVVVGNSPKENIENTSPQK